MNNEYKEEEVLSDIKEGIDGSKFKFEKKIILDSYVLNTWE